jgi:hypothetical protein
VIKVLNRISSGFRGAEMKKIIVSVAIVLAIILMTLTLQSCFTPYPAQGTPEQAAKDREIREQIQRDMYRP